MSSPSLLQKLTEIPLEVRPVVANGLWEQLGAGGFDTTELARVRGLLDCWAGVRPKALRPNQEAICDLYMPDLDHDEPWLDPALFAIAADMEASFGAVREEFDGLRGSGVPFRPYGRGPDESPDAGPLPGVPEGWNEFALMREFQRVPAHFERAPVAGRLAERALGYHGVVAQFTYLVLGPGAMIPWHADTANFIVSCHLGLRVPPGCTLAVGDEERTWSEGRCIAFNNSFRHQAENRSTEPRAILSMHALHPALTPGERRAITALIEGLGQI